MLKAHKVDTTHTLICNRIGSLIPISLVPRPHPLLIEGCGLGRRLHTHRLTVDGQLV